MLPIFVKLFTSVNEREWWVDLETNHRAIETFKGTNPG